MIYFPNATVAKKAEIATREAISRISHTPHGQHLDNLGCPPRPDIYAFSLQSALEAPCIKVYNTANPSKSRAASVSNLRTALAASLVFHRDSFILSSPCPPNREGNKLSGGTA